MFISTSFRLQAPAEFNVARVCFESEKLAKVMRRVNRKTRSQHRQSPLPLLHTSSPPRLSLKYRLPLEHHPLLLLPLSARAQFLYLSPPLRLSPPIQLLPPPVQTSCKLSLTSTWRRRGEIEMFLENKLEIKGILGI